MPEKMVTAKIDAKAGTVTLEGEQLTAQATGQPKFPIYPESENWGVCGRTGTLERRQFCERSVLRDRSPGKRSSLNPPLAT